MPLYFFKRNGSVIIFNRSSNKKRKYMGLKITHRKHEFKKRFYDVYYFNGESEKLFLLKNMLQLVNSKKHIQLTEKREMSALIIEKGCIFPKDYEINPLKVNALVEMKKEIERIRNNFLERALNELESIYFYNKSWVERIDKLLHTSSDDIINIMNKIEILTNEKI
ncbi:MAG: hypothetical protein IBX60_06550 [Candidatus Aminicenantes bacterium]|nr:hypothetical protein [Candidatus Aminicenantes bacterium]